MRAFVVFGRGVYTLSALRRSPAPISAGFSNVNNKKNRKKAKDRRQDSLTHVGAGLDSIDLSVCVAHGWCR